ncbi:hypothetical protein FGO68_gene5011 [Halteria grandinella]|uniref:RING-type domain-containing protein n=1 Tax=Halteria grandinella TaxID=5974 RepID=A0A8J8T4I2_HALGN|nr:hypothetical protein FGO68_gene5011 [Halteria grandinella]
MNCIAVIQKSEATEQDVKRLERIDITFDQTCSICLDVAVQPYSLECEHSFCKECIKGWHQRSQECPTCRAPIKNLR